MIQFEETHLLRRLLTIWFTSRVYSGRDQSSNMEEGLDDRTATCASGVGAAVIEVMLVMRKTERRETSVRILEDYYEGSIDMWLRVAEI